jgi:hypothetical protein
VTSLLSIVNWKERPMSRNQPKSTDRRRRPLTGLDRDASAFTSATTTYKATTYKATTYKAMA